jgi:hypothetical protein
MARVEPQNLGERGQDDVKLYTFGPAAKGLSPSSKRGKRAESTPKSH